jgi:hypothetical protein
MTIAAPHTAAPPGLPKDEGLTTGGTVQALREQAQASSDTAHPTEAEAAVKTLATLRAEAARAGFALHELVDGGFVLCRWAYSTGTLPDIRAVRVALRTMLGRCV